MKCPRCQADNRDGARFCRECGASFAAACPSCGAKLDAGSRFCDSCGAAMAAAATPAEAPSRFAAPETYTPRHLAERIINSKAALEGERKQVSVLFADLKGSMELLADRDPEEARNILDPVLELMMEAVHHYEGTVNQVMGDGIMALFGAPVAHEDHAVRACYAALRMQEAVKSYAQKLSGSRGVSVQIRVGLNCGDVVVRAIGSDLRMDYTAVGQTTHLAARMEQLAPTGAVYATAAVLRLAGGHVTAREIGPTQVKGLPNPVRIWDITGTRAAPLGVGGVASPALTPFVGRDEPMRKLVNALSFAEGGGRAARRGCRRGRRREVQIVLGVLPAARDGGVDRAESMLRVLRKGIALPANRGPSQARFPDRRDGHCSGYRGSGAGRPGSFGPRLAAGRAGAFGRPRCAL